MRESCRTLWEFPHWPVPLTLHDPSSPEPGQNAWDPLSIDASGEGSKI